MRISVEKNVEEIILKYYHDETSKEINIDVVIKKSKETGIKKCGFPDICSYEEILQNRPIGIQIWMLIKAGIKVLLRKEVLDQIRDDPLHKIAESSEYLR